MKTCRDFESLLSLFAGEELEAEHSASVAAHLATCAECRQKVTAYQQLAKHLAAIAKPALPENLFDDFHEGIVKKIHTGAAAQSRMLGLLAVIHALNRRQRLAFALTILAVLMTLTFMLSTQRFRNMSQPRHPLAQLLEKRDWAALYYAVRDGASRQALLDEPVPAKLWQAALMELVEAQRQNRKVCEGLQRILGKAALARGSPSWLLGESAHILGKITVTGYAPTKSASRVKWNVEDVLQALLEVDEDTNITMREIMLRLT